MKKYIKILVMVLCLMVTLVAFSGCNTVKDIINEINETAKEQQSYIKSIEEELKEDIANGNESTEYTQSELEQMALDYYEKLTGYRPGYVASELNQAGELVIQLYDTFSDHISTSDWYTIDINTAKGTDLLGNEIDLTSIGNLIDSNSNTSKSSSGSLSNEEALNIGNELYKKAKAYYWTEGINYGNNLVDGMYYAVSNIDTVKSFFSENGFSQFMKNNGFIQEIEGKYYRVAADRGGDISYLGNELKVDSITENKITFTSVEKYIAKDEEWGLDESLVTEITKKEHKFVIVKENGIWKVEEFTLAD